MYFYECVRNLILCFNGEGGKKKLRKKNSPGMQLKNKSAVCQLEYVIPKHSLP